MSEKNTLLALFVFVALGSLAFLVYLQNGISDQPAMSPAVVQDKDDKDLKTVTPPTTPEKYPKALSKVFAVYLDFSAALADDDQKKAFDGWMSCSSAAGELNGLNGDDFDEKRRKEWLKAREAIMKLFPFSTNEKSPLLILRANFYDLSKALIEAIKKFGHAENGPIYAIYCSMAFNNRGASWLQKDKDVRNPYYGKEMLKCGMAKEKILPPAKPKKCPS